MPLINKLRILSTSETSSKTSIFSQFYRSKPKSITTKGLRYLQIRENSVRENKNIEVQHIPGKINPADMFSKEDKDAAHFKQLRDATVSTPFAKPQSENENAANPTTNATYMNSSKTQPCIESSKECRSFDGPQSVDIQKIYFPGTSSHVPSPCFDSTNSTKTNKIQNNEPPLKTESAYLQNFPLITINSETFKEPTKIKSISPISSYVEAVLGQKKSNEKSDINNDHRISSQRSMGGFTYVHYLL